MQASWEAICENQRSKESWRRRRPGNKAMSNPPSPQTVGKPGGTCTRVLGKLSGRWGRSIKQSQDRISTATGGEAERKRRKRTLEPAVTGTDGSQGLGLVAVAHGRLGHLHAVEMHTPASKLGNKAEQLAHLRVDSTYL